MPRLRILVLSASARTRSHNAALAALVARRMTRAGSEVTLTNIRDFPAPLYDGDYQSEFGVPEAARRLAALLGEYDGVVIVSPEYNYSMPGVLKNLVDWVSRIKPWPTIGVNGLLMSASPSAVGGHRGLIALRVPLEGLGARLYPDMFCLAGADTAFTPDGELADVASSDRLDHPVGHPTETVLGKWLRCQPGPQYEAFMVGVPGGHAEGERIGPRCALVRGNRPATQVSGGVGADPTDTGRLS